MRYLFVIPACTFFFITLGFAHAEEDGGPLSFPKWKPASTEYTRVQTADWLDSDRFAVGRWDGSISVFRKPASGEFTPVLLDIWRTQDGSGVEMLHTLDASTLLASNGSAALAVLALDSSRAQVDLPYDPQFGVANSAVSATVEGQDVIVTGHAQGHILIWRRDGLTIKLDRSLNLASSNPIPSPYPLKNIRGLARWGDSHIVAGSEDGDLTIVDLVTNAIALRQRYNENAQRGINNISVIDNYLLLANCSVGRTDKNLWLFSIDTPDKLTLLDAIDLKDDLSRPQSFNFDADLVRQDDVYQFYASTEEGFLWGGELEENKLVPTKTAFIASEGGALLDFSDDLSTLLAAARKLYLFKPL